MNFLLLGLQGLVGVLAVSAAKRAGVRLCLSPSLSLCLQAGSPLGLAQ